MVQLRERDVYTVAADVGWLRVRPQLSSGPAELLARDI